MLRRGTMILCALGLACCCAAVASATNYTFYDLTVAGDTSSYAYGINSSNEVVGRYFPSTGYSYASIWSLSAGTYTRTQLPWNNPSATNSNRGGTGSAINDYGTVVGQSAGLPAINNNSAFSWVPTVANGTTGTITNVGTKMGVSAASRFQAINSAGQSVGYGNGTGAGAYYWDGVSASATLIPMGSGNTNAFSFGAGINNSGLVVGSGVIGGTQSAVTWQASTPTVAVHSINPDIAIAVSATHGGVASLGVGVNDSGEIVGWFTDEWSTTGFPFLYKDSTHIVQLPAVGGGAGEGHAEAINASGCVVGWGSAATGQDAFLWTPDTPNGTTGTMVDLNSLPIASSLPSGYHFYDAFAINASGSIVGTLSNASLTSFRAFALIAPVPEPSTLLLAVAGLVGLLAYAWRKRK
jgi:probable HAF family extracellular repeat protein